jgi:hypothetical protein
MKKIYYRSGKTAFAALGAGGLAILCAWFWIDDGSTKMGLAALFFGALAVLGTRKAFSGRPALQYNDQELVIDKFFGPVNLKWRQVQRIMIEQITLRYMGIIPVSKQQFLVIRGDGGLFGSTNHRIAASAITLPPGGIAELCAVLTMVHVAAVGHAGVVMKGAGSNGWGADSSPAPAPIQREDPEGAAFDADAAIARYLAQKQTVEACTGTPQQAHAPMAVRPPRPTFGRKVG